MGRDFTRLPMEWVERIFERMECIYKNRWLEFVGNENQQLILKTIWSTGLSGLDAIAIKKALSMCESFPHASIPTHIEFYHYAKGIRYIKVPSHSLHHPMSLNEKKSDSELAKKYLSDIKQKLKGST